MRHDSKSKAARGQIYKAGSRPASEQGRSKLEPTSTAVNLPGMWISTDL